MTTVILASDSFAPLVKMQAKARKVEPRLAVFKHPLGGLGAEELQDRIEAAWKGLLEAMKRDQ
jgi:hypothetical protein